jgi:hypothetical protein
MYLVLVVLNSNYETDMANKLFMVNIVKFVMVWAAKLNFHLTKHFNSLTTLYIKQWLNLQYFFSVQYNKTSEHPDKNIADTKTIKLAESCFVSKYNWDYRIRWKTGQRD